MKGLPYFRWFTKDAEADEAYTSMDDRELGFFHRCLNRAWDNDGLPSDLDELARVLHVSREYLDSVWVRVGRCWHEREGRLFNNRQELEREHARAKSQKATDSASKRYERTANALRTQSERTARAYDSDSVSASSSASGKGVQGENQKRAVVRSREISPAWKRDEQFARFATDYLSTGAALIDADFAAAYDSWERLNLGQRLERVAGLNRHMGEYSADPRFVPKPLKFLETEWERPLRPPGRATRASDDQQRRDEAIEGMRLLERIRRS